MSFLTPEKTVNKKKSVESIPFIPKKVVANPDADKRYPIPHTRIDMRPGIAIGWLCHNYIYLNKNEC